VCERKRERDSGERGRGRFVSVRERERESGERETERDVRERKIYGVKEEVGFNFLRV
jgi:hypothetical protein